MEQRLSQTSTTERNRAYEEWTKKESQKAVATPKSSSVPVERARKIEKSGHLPSLLCSAQKTAQVCSGNSYVLLIDLNCAVGEKQKRQKTDFFSKRAWVGIIVTLLQQNRLSKEITFNQTAGSRFRPSVTWLQNRPHVHIGLHHAAFLVLRSSGERWQEGHFN